MENNKYKVLIVDDDDFLLDMYSVKLKEAGFNVEVAKNGEESLAKMRSETDIDVVLLDVVMPDLDGFEVFRTVKREKILPQAVFIFLSNIGQKEEVDKGMQLGAEDYIVKAYFTPSEVVQKIERALNKNK